MTKLALVSHILPPSRSGQATVLCRLFKDLPPQDYCLLSQQTHDAEQERANPERLPGIYYHLASPAQLTRGTRFGILGWRRRINLSLDLLDYPRRLAAITSILRREACTAVLACTGNILNMPAAYQASRKLGLPFYAYIFDDFAYQWTEPVARRLARSLEPGLLRNAAGIITANEFMRDALAARYGVQAAVIHNPCDLAQYADQPLVADPVGDQALDILYTGTIYEAQIDALLDLAGALKILGRPEVHLHIYSAFEVQVVRAAGPAGAVLLHPHQQMAAMPAIQQQAGILFLPLAFRSRFPEVIRTSAPGKMGEYLASGRPILVHAPADSFVAWYFRHYDCGLVVDEQSPDKLATAIRALAADATLRRNLAARARERALADFSIETAQAQFAAFLGLRLLHPAAPRALPAITETGA